MRSKPYLLEPGHGFPVIQMIDILLLLLVFFMLMNRSLPPSLSVALPEATTSREDDRAAIAVSIDAAGQVTLNGVLTDWAELPGLLAGRDPETLVRIAADRATDYDYIVKAMDAAAQAKLSNIALETVRVLPPQQSAPAGPTPPATAPPGA
jgi:biopolymer transport protein ExbD